MKTLWPLCVLIIAAFFCLASRYKPSTIEDFANLATFQEANLKLQASPTAVFIGDSITALWGLSASFHEKNYENRGIGWQTSQQVLLRMHQDVVQLHPRSVIISVGTNDLAGVTGNSSIEQIEANYEGMYEIASSNGIHVAFASVLPVHEYTNKAKSVHVLATHPIEKIRALNSWLQEFCEHKQLTYLDYFSPMVDHNGFLRPELSDDGIHPNKKGYEIMTSVVSGAGL